MSDAVFVEAPARLHFGVLDLRGALGRWFGGIGAAAPAPTLLRLGVARRHARASRARTPSARPASPAGFSRITASTGGARVHVHRALPPHAGLGSGTQLALAVARALAEICTASPTDAPALARAVGRAQRSAIGTWTFAGGGLVVEGGRTREGGRRRAAARAPAVSVRRGAASSPCRTPRRDERRRRSGGVRAAAAAARARRRARGASRPDGAAAGARGCRSRTFGPR